MISTHVTHVALQPDATLLSDGPWAGPSLRMEKDEVMLLKCWDSRGVDFLQYSEADGPKEPVPATFSLHGSFEDLAGATQIETGMDDWVLGHMSHVPGISV